MQQQTLKVKVKKLCSHIDTTPRYGSLGAACFDFVSAETKTIYPKTQEIFKLGVAMELPPGTALMMYSRSGLGHKHGIVVTHGVGIIDSDYRGEIHCGLYNHFTVPFTVCAGDRIAQGMVIPVPKVEFEQVEELSETERGTGGFGSTGLTSI